MKSYLVYCLVFGLLNSSMAFADSDEQALQEAQNVLKSQHEREAILKENPKAQKADDLASSAVNNDPNLKNEVYNISADVLATVLKEANGDSAKAQEKLMEAARNPSAFLDKLPADQKEKIKNLAHSVDSKNKQTKP